jgi:uncharacterized protein (TIGR02246 family)
MRLSHVLAFSICFIPVFAQGKPQVSTHRATISDEIIAQENAYHESYRNRDTAALEMLMLPDFTNVEQMIWNREQVLSFVKKFHEQCSLAPVKIVDPNVSFLSPDIARIVYHATETPTCGARTMSGETNISTVWVRKDGRWKMYLHTEYALPQ